MNILQTVRSWSGWPVVGFGAGIAAFYYTIDILRRLVH